MEFVIPREEKETRIMVKEKTFKGKISASGFDISVVSTGTTDDYISLTDIAKRMNSEDPRFPIQNWMRNRNTIEFLATWEKLYNPDFNRVQFEAVMEEAGLNRFVMTPQKWINTTNSIGIRSASGRYGGTFAHKDIAFEFASWVSPEFKLYIIKDYQRLKEDENSRLSLNWNVRRALSKVNYRIHTDAIKKHLIPNDIPAKYKGYTYASEADILNVALFGTTAKEWRDSNAEKKGNIRDEATIEQLVILINLEGLNAELIKNGTSQDDRLKILCESAQVQMQSLLENPSMKSLKENDAKKLLK